MVIWEDFWSTEAQVLKKLELDFSLTRAKNYLFRLCLDRPEFCEFGPKALKEACKKGGTREKECSTIVNEVVSSYCEGEIAKKLDVCKTNVDKNSNSTVTDAITDAVDATTKGNKNLLIIGAIGGLVLLIAVAIIAYCLCIKKSTPPTPPPAPVTATTTGSGKRHKKHRKHKKKKAKKTTTAGDDSNTSKAPNSASKATKTPEEIV